MDGVAIPESPEQPQPESQASAAAPSGEVVQQNMFHQVANDDHIVEDEDDEATELPWVAGSSA